MANTRDFNSLGVMASDALEVTEDGVREQGVAYRRTNLSDVVQIEGEIYDEPPITENINQKLFNQSSFTDIIDTTGVLGWTNLVDYSPPAMVWANDGTPNTGDFYLCLRDSGPSTSVFDPLSDDQSNPVFWRILENPGQLRLDLADETPGSEGSRLVGYNNVNTNGGIDVGLTVKAALDVIYNRVNPLNDFEVLANLNVKLQVDVGAPPFISLVDTISKFNVDDGNYEVIPGVTGGPSEFAQGFRFHFINPLPVDYKIFFKQWGQVEFLGVIGTGQNTISFLNKTINSIEIYQEVVPIKSIQDYFSVGTEVRYLQDVQYFLYENCFIQD